MLNKSGKLNLKDCINSLFHRWRIAKIVDNFFKMILQHVNDEPIGNGNSSILTAAQKIPQYTHTLDNEYENSDKCLSSYKLSARKLVETYYQNFKCP